MSTYFTFANRYQPGTKAKAEDVNADFDRVVTAFAAVATDIAGVQNASMGYSASIASAVNAANAAQTSATAATAAASGALPRAGGTMSGPIVLSANASQPLHPVTLQQMSAAIVAAASGVSTFNGRGGAVTLSNADVLAAIGFTPANNASVAALSGAAFSGALSSTTTITATGGLFGLSATIRGPVLFGEGILATQGQAFIGAGNATTPILAFDSNDFFTYDRTGNVLTWNLNGIGQFSSDATRFTIARNYLRISGANDGTFAYFECQSPHLAFSKKSGGYDFYWRRNDDGTASGANSVQLMDLNDAGNLTTTGLVYGRGGGAGIGQFIVQFGTATPTGGANGDIVIGI